MRNRTLLGADRYGRRYWIDSDGYAYFHEPSDPRDFICTRGRVVFSSDSFIVIA
jgi:hypothetical protein